MSTKKPGKKVKAKEQPKAAPTKELSEAELDHVAGGSGGGRPLKASEWSGPGDEGPIE